MYIFVENCEWQTHRKARLKIEKGKEKIGHARSTSIPFCHLHERLIKFEYIFNLTKVITINWKYMAATLKF